jgi:hypothetical protein
MQTDENRVRRLHALRYAGRSPCRCFAPVLIREDGELSQTGSTSISRKPTCRLANQQVLKVAQLPSVLQLRPSVSGRPATNLIPSRGPLPIHYWSFRVCSTRWLMRLERGFNRSKLATPSPGFPLCGWISDSKTLIPFPAGLIPLSNVNDPLGFLVRHGPAILFAAVFIEKIGLPIPAAPVLLTAGLWWLPIKRVG